MTTFKLFAAALLIGTASLVNAQTKIKDNSSCEEMVKARTELLTKELALDKRQAAQVHELLAENEKSLTGMRGHCEVMDAKAEKQDDATYASIAKLLTPEQQKKMDALQESGKLQACGKKGGKGCCAGKSKGKSKAQGLQKAENKQLKQTKSSTSLDPASIKSATK